MGEFRTFLEGNITLQNINFIIDPPIIKLYELTKASEREFIKGICVPDGRIFWTTTDKEHNTLCRILMGKNFWDTEYDPRVTAYYYPKGGVSATVLDGIPQKVAHAFNFSVYTNILLDTPRPVINAFNKLNKYVLKFNKEKLQFEAWSPFAPRQRELPFMYEPGLQRKAGKYMDRSYLSPDDEKEYENFNLYHVTINLAGVLTAGGLKSRAQLGTTGLGGGWEDEAKNLISTTHDSGRARLIYDGILWVCSIVQGNARASTIWSDTTGYYDDYDEVVKVIYDFIPKKIAKEMKDGNVSWDEMLDKYITTPQQKYDFFKKLEQAIVAAELENDETYELSPVGFTGSFEDMLKINPSQVAILQLAVRKGAWSEHKPLEREIRFRPQDLRVIRYTKP